MIDNNRLPAAHSIHVLALEHGMISRLTLFVQYADPRLFHAFGLPLILPDDASAELMSTPQFNRIRDTTESKCC
jgi:hypothetical protein